MASPWGLFQPKFLPESVGPASGALQKVMEEVFQDFRDWMINMRNLYRTTTIDAEHRSERLIVQSFESLSNFSEEMFR